MTTVKLVRDRIPEIIRESGETPIYWQAEGATYLKLLWRKLREECAEARAASDDALLDELADVIEVTRAIAEYHGYSIDEVMHAAEIKAGKRGRFRAGFAWAGNAERKTQ